MAERTENITIESIRPTFWKLRKPVALSADGWDDWNEIARAEFPIRYWIQEEAFSWIRIKCLRLLDKRWWFIHRFHPKHRYHVVDSGLPPGYYDPCTLVLHVPFNIFDRFMQHQTSDECHIDWTFHAEEWAEMNELWEWWKQRDTREERFEQEHPLPDLPDEWGILSVCSDRKREDPRMIAYKEVLRLHSEQEEVWNREDDEMLVRLARIRRFLWD